MHALADAEALADWPFMPPYDPLDYEPMRTRPDASPFPAYNPLDEPPPVEGLSLRRRLAVFTLRWLGYATAWTVGALGVLALLWGRA
jgi:hypothetical protein